MSTETASTSESPSPAKLKQRVAELERENSILQMSLAARLSLDDIFRQYGQDDNRVAQMLNGCTESNQIWVAIMTTLKSSIKYWHDAGIAALSLSNDELRADIARQHALEELEVLLLKLRAIGNGVVSAPTGS